MTKLDIEGSASTFLYFGFTSIMVFMFFLLTGVYKIIMYSDPSPNMIFVARQYIMLTENHNMQVFYKEFP